MENKRVFYVNVSNINKEDLQKYLQIIKEKIESGEVDSKLDLTNPNINKLDPYFVPIIGGEKIFELKDNEVCINDVKRFCKMLEDK